MPKTKRKQRPKKDVLTFPYRIFSARGNTTRKLFRNPFLEKMMRKKRHEKNHGPPQYSKLENQSDRASVGTKLVPKFGSTVCIKQALRSLPVNAPQKPQHRGFEGHIDHPTHPASHVTSSFCVFNVYGRVRHRTEHALSAGVCCPGPGPPASGQEPSQIQNLP